jgi:hypothetical protein
LGRVDTMRGNEVELAARMRAGREVHNKRRVDQAKVEVEAKLEGIREARIVGRTRKVTRCSVCDVGPDQPCEMRGSFENCPMRQNV